MEQLHLLDNEKTKRFIFAGNALITVRNEATGNRFTFKIEKRKAHPIRIDLYWVKVLTMPDNESDGSYKFIGSLSKEEGYRHSPKSFINPESTSAKVASYYFNRLLLKTKNQLPLPESIKTYHMGVCGRCGHLLTVPESIETGFGEECARQLNIPFEVRKSTFKQTLFDVPSSGVADYQITHSQSLFTAVVNQPYV